MDIADPILPSSCAQSAELSKDLTNDKEQSDMHVDSTAVNKEHINDKSDNECSIEQEKNNVLPENMEISSDSVEKGKASKCTYEYTKFPASIKKIFNGSFPALNENAIVFIYLFLCHLLLTLNKKYLFSKS